MALRGFVAAGMLAVLLAGCGARPPVRNVATDPPERELLLRAAAEEVAAGRFGFPVEFLGSAGAEASRWLRPLLESEDREVRLVARALLLSAGEDLEMTSAEEVDVLLFDLTREERHPFAGIRALERLRRLGVEAVPALEAARDEGGDRGELARRLLRRMEESP